MINLEQNFSLRLEMAKWIFQTKDVNISMDVFTGFFQFLGFEDPMNLNLVVKAKSLVLNFRSLAEMPLGFQIRMGKQ